MAFIPNSVLEYFQGGHQTAFKEYMTELEQQLGAPVRIVDGENEGRSLSRAHDWRGVSGEEHRYPDFTADDIRERGYTIFTRSWNSDIETDNVGGWRFFSADHNMWKEFRARFHNEIMRNERNVEIEVQATGINVDKIVEAGGSVLATDDGLALAEFYEGGRVTFMHTFIASYSSWGTPDWDVVFGAMLKGGVDQEALAQRMAEAAERREQKTRDAFRRMVNEQANAGIARVMTERNAVATRVTTLEENLVNAKAHMTGLNNQFKYLVEREGGDLTDERVNREWDAITRNVHVKRFDIGTDEQEDYNGRYTENPYIKLYTDLLWLKHPETNRELPLGEYEVTMNFGAGNLRIINLTNAQRGGNGRGGEGNFLWQHPHVNEGGGLCQAGYATAITQQLRDRQLAGMTNMMFSILSTLTVNDDWGKHNVKLWEASDDKQREEKGWPAWVAGEAMHPMKAEQENTNA